MASTTSEIVRARPVAAGASAARLSGPGSIVVVTRWSGDSSTVRPRATTPRYQERVRAPDVLWAVINLTRSRRRQGMSILAQVESTPAGRAPAAVEPRLSNAVALLSSTPAAIRPGADLSA